MLRTGDEHPDWAKLGSDNYVAVSAGKKKAETTRAAVDLDAGGDTPALLTWERAVNAASRLGRSALHKTKDEAKTAE